MLLGQPEPLQPEDAPDDRIIRMEVSTRYTLNFLDSVEFVCARCHTHYSRRIEGREILEGIVEVEGVGKYGLNPRIEYQYAANPHTCG